MDDNIYDVGIIGGGPAGSLAAANLAAAGLRVFLAEAGTDSDFKPGEGLPPAARRILMECGIWEEFLDQGHLSSYGNRSAWGSSKLHYADFIHSPDGNGYHLNRAKFDALLRQYATKSGALVETNTRLTTLKQIGDSWNLTFLSEGKKVTRKAKFLVDATGRARKVLRHLEIPFEFADKQICFYQLFAQNPAQLDKDMDASGLVESVSNGWWYTSRLPEEKRIAIFFCDAGSGVSKVAGEYEGFTGLMEETVHIRQEITQNGYEPIGTPVGTDARTGRSNELFGTGWCAIGDAAVSFDPLSSQGLLTAMYAGIRVKEGIMESLKGNSKPLEAYANNLIAIYETFQANQMRFYHGENRWKKEGFWKERQG